MKIRYFIIWILVVISIAGWGPLSFLFREHNKEHFGTQPWLDKEIELISAQADNINLYVLKLALKAFIKAREEGLDTKQLLTVIDYSKSSSERRLWVIDLKNDSVLYNTWVSHGKNSGDIYTTSFSNKLGSLQSSYGVFMTTTEPYVGDNGYSLRLIGLEPGINDNAYKRDIVFHGAWYVNPEVIHKYGHLGRSWGCPAVSDRLAKPLIDTIKEKTLVFAYTNDPDWIQNSPYLNGATGLRL